MRTKTYFQNNQIVEEMLYSTAGFVECFKQQIRTQNLRIPKQPIFNHNLNSNTFLILWHWCHAWLNCIKSHVVLTSKLAEMPHLINCQMFSEKQ
jgi:hypothetical protein